MAPPMTRKRSRSSSSSPAPVTLLALIAAVLLCLTTFTTTVSAFNYAEALDKALLFFEAQRSGKLPPPGPHHRVTWRGDSGLTDGAAAGVDLTGGYYDAGDNVKFGFPMAFSVTMLSWSVLEFITPNSGDVGAGRAAMRWGADYLLKASAAAPYKLYVQVADPYQDHRCWERPEDMDTSREVYSVSPEKPGSDVAGETAAALAAASIVFRECDPAYSAKLLQTAQKVFDFADRYRGSYSDSLSSVVCPFYCSYSGYHDELLWAAAWLHKATTAVGNSSSSDTYLSYIKSNGPNLGAEQDDFTFSWDDKRAGTKVLLAKAFLQQQQQGTTGNNGAAAAADALRVYKTHADAYVCSLLPPSPSQQFTPGGLLFKSGDCNMQYVTSTAFLLLSYATSLSSSSSISGEVHQLSSAVSCGGGVRVPAAALVAVAKRQVDYILGANPAGRSYMVGFAGVGGGAGFPRRVHHRGASMPSVRDHPGRIGCEEGFRYLHSSEPDANLLVGAVVGGPDGSDGFTDSRDNYAQTEPSTYTNAPLVGALAFFAGGGGRHR